VAVEPTSTSSPVSCPPSRHPPPAARADGPAWPAPPPLAFRGSSPLRRFRTEAWRAPCAKNRLDRAGGAFSSGGTVIKSSSTVKVALILSMARPRSEPERGVLHPWGSEVGWDGQDSFGLSSGVNRGSPMAHVGGGPWLYMHQSTSIKWRIRQVSEPSGSLTGRHPWLPSPAKIG
jgi:hypothetical protein